MTAAPSSAERLKALAGCGDAELRAAILELCAEFGTVRSIDIMTVLEAGKKRALCFLRLDSEAQEIALVRTLGVSRFGSEVLVVVDLAR